MNNLRYDKYDIRREVKKQLIEDGIESAEAKINIFYRTAAGVAIFGYIGSFCFNHDNNKSTKTESADSISSERANTMRREMRWVARMGAGSLCLFGLGVLARWRQDYLKHELRQYN